MNAKQLLLPNAPSPWYRCECQQLVLKRLKEKHERSIKHKIRLLKLRGEW